jgi:hypothetical protein
MPIMKVIRIIILLLISTFSLIAQEHKITAESVQAILATGKQYTLVLLKNGPNKKAIDPVADQTMLMNHLVELFTMKEQGKLPVFGPVLKEGDLQGICIFNTTDEAEVKKLMVEDPLVKDGHLIYEMYPWFSIPGFTLPEK